VTNLRDDGEPVTSGRRDRTAAERRAQRDVLVFVAIFGGVLLINGLLTVLLIACLEALGWWNPATVVESLIGPAHGRPWPST
jgi:hypothetical protein